MPKTKKELFPQERAALKAWLKNYTEFYPGRDKVLREILTQEEFRKAETVYRKSIQLQSGL